MRVLVSDALELGDQTGIYTEGQVSYSWQYLPEARAFLVNRVHNSLLAQDLNRLMIIIPAIGICSILLMTLLMLTLSRSFTRPVRKLQRTVAAIAKGTYDGTEPLRLQDELGQLSQAITRMYRTINEQMDALRSEQEARSRA